ncbi:MAG: RNA polymerase sigma factor [Akkermansiaceae bacterium]|nr:RNA polymerase sigma factor [Armatimonadota bacterium]
MMLETEPKYPSDTDLIYQTLRGDHLAAEQLTDRYRRMVYATAYHALGNTDDAQDVAQEALVYAYQRLTDIRDTTRFAGWLRHVTLSLCVDYRRRRGTRRLGEPINLLNEMSEEADHVQRLAVRQAMAHLSDDHRTTLLLHYLGGWSLGEVASMMATSVNTVRSRLMAAKQRMRTDLNDTLFPGGVLPTGNQRPLMSAKTLTLSKNQQMLIEAAFPGARVLSVQHNPEPWMPFSPRVQLQLRDGDGKTVDFRGGIDPQRVALLSVLERRNIPGPRLLHGPMATEEGWLSLCETPRGENVTLWTLGGTPHRIRLATERAIEGIDRLHGATDALLADSIGAQLPRRTLSDELAILTDDALWNADSWLAEEGKSRHEWLRDPWFMAALAKVESAVKEIRDPLVYTNYTFFFPQEYRIRSGDEVNDEPLGYPGDPKYQENPLVEFVNPFGHFGDPLLGLAMLWVYDCYPFVHTGFVEQFLWRRGVSRREFAPRLALKALQMVARDLPVTRAAAGGRFRPADGGRYWDSLRSWADQGLSWM